MTYFDSFSDRNDRLATDWIHTKNFLCFFFRKQQQSAKQAESSASTDTLSDASDKQGMVAQVMSPRKKGTKKTRKKHTQSQLSIGRKSNKLIITMPTGDKSSGDSSSPQRAARNSPNRRKDTRQKESKSPVPIVIDSDEGVPTTCSGKKRKPVQQDDDTIKKKAKVSNSGGKKNGRSSKNGCVKGSAQKRGDDSSASSSDATVLTFEQFMRDPDLKKWQYVIDVISDEEVEAIQILIDERHLAEKEKEQKDIERQQKKAQQEVKKGKTGIKAERQTDGSCDKTESSSGSSTDSSVGQKKCRKKLAKEFVVYTMVGNEKRMLKLIEMDTEDTSLESALFMPDKSDVDSMDHDGVSDGFGGDVDTECTENETEENKDSGVETESSIVELKVTKSPILYHSVDTDSDRGNDKSTSTDKIYSGFCEGERMSLASTSDFKCTSSQGTVELSSDSRKADVSDADSVKVLESVKNGQQLGPTVSKETPTDSTEKPTEKRNPQTENDEASTEGAEDATTDPVGNSEIPPSAAEVQKQGIEGDITNTVKPEGGIPGTDIVTDSTVNSSEADVPKTSPEVNSVEKAEVPPSAAEVQQQGIVVDVTNTVEPEVDIPGTDIVTDSVVNSSAADVPKTSPEVNSSIADVPKNSPAVNSSVADVPKNSLEVSSVADVPKTADVQDNCTATEMTGTTTESTGTTSAKQEFQDAFGLQHMK